MFDIWVITLWEKKSTKYCFTKSIFCNSCYSYIYLEKCITNVSSNVCLFINASICTLASLTISTTCTPFSKRNCNPLFKTSLFQNRALSSCHSLVHDNDAQYCVGLIFHKGVCTILSTVTRTVHASISFQ